MGMAFQFLNLTNTTGDCLCVVILWLALSQPFGLRLALGVPQQSPCVLVFPRLT